MVSWAPNFTTPHLGLIIGGSGPRSWWPLGPPTLPSRVLRGPGSKYLAFLWVGLAFLCFLGVKLRFPTGIGLPVGWSIGFGVALLLNAAASSSTFVVIRLLRRLFYCCYSSCYSCASSLVLSLLSFLLFLILFSWLRFLFWAFAWQQLGAAERLGWRFMVYGCLACGKLKRGRLPIGSSSCAACEAHRHPGTSVLACLDQLCLPATVLFMLGPNSTQ